MRACAYAWMMKHTSNKGTHDLQMGGGGGEGCEKKSIVCTPTKVTMRPTLRDNAVKECVESRGQVRLLNGMMCIYPP